MCRYRDDPCFLGLDELAGEEREISSDSQLSVEEYRLCFDLCHGSLVLGCSERHRNNS